MDQRNRTMVFYDAKGFLSSGDSIKFPSVQRDKKKKP